MTDANLVRVFEAMKQQREQADAKRLEEIQTQWTTFGEIRDNSLLLRIGYSSPEFAEQCLAAHPAKRLWTSVGNVKRAFEILVDCRADLIDLGGSFHARITHNQFGREIQDTTLTEATKSVYTYSCASTSLVQAYRHLVSGHEEIKQRYDEVRKEVFGNQPIMEFFAQLRNANNHLGILVANPHFKITKSFQDGTEQVISGLSFNREQVLNSPDWSSDSRQFVASRDALDAVRLINEHFDLVARFKQIVFTRTGIYSHPGYRDYERILRARESASLRMSLGLILQQAVPRKLNPYEYLDQWFTKEELQRIGVFRDHTKEQLEYMISLRDPFGFCDRHTRQQLYELFGVPLDQLPTQGQEKPRIEV